MKVKPLTLHYDVESSIGYIESSIGYIESSIGYIESSIGYIESSIGYIESSIGYIESSIVSLTFDSVEFTRFISMNTLKEIISQTDLYIVKLSSKTCF